MNYSAISVPGRNHQGGTAGTEGFQPRHRRDTDLEALLVWVYRDQRADVNALKAGRATKPGGWGPSNAASMMRRGMLGVKIDCAGSAAMDAGVCHPDAELVHDAVMRLDDLGAGLVVHHARTASRPALDDPDSVPEVEPVRRSNGKVRVEDGPDGKFCPVRYSIDPEHSAFLLGVYRHWVRAMETVRIEVEGQLGDWHVTATAGPEVLAIAGE